MDRWRRCEEPRTVLLVLCCFSIGRYCHISSELHFKQHIGGGSHALTVECLTQHLLWWPSILYMFQFLLLQYFFPLTRLLFQRLISRSAQEHASFWNKPFSFYYLWLVQHTCKCSFMSISKPLLFKAHTYFYFKYMRATRFISSLLTSKKTWVLKSIFLKMAEVYLWHMKHRWENIQIPLSPTGYSETKLMKKHIPQ